MAPTPKSSLDKGDLSHWGHHSMSFSVTAKVSGAVRRRHRPEKADD